MAGDFDRIGRLGAWSRRSLLLAGLGALAAGCAGESDLAEGEAGRIARVLDADSLALDTGLRVRLAEVEVPAAGYGDRAGEPGWEAAQGVLERAALGRQARLWYGGLSRDRYERAIANVIARDEVGADVWLNGLAVRQGAARVRTYPDNATRARRDQIRCRGAAGRGGCRRACWREAARARADRHAAG